MLRERLRAELPKRFQAAFIRSVFFLTSKQASPNGHYRIGALICPRLGRPGIGEEDVRVFWAAKHLTSELFR
jgi:hypothetical protein